MTLRCHSLQELEYRQREVEERELRVYGHYRPRGRSFTTRQKPASTVVRMGRDQETYCTTLPPGTGLCYRPHVEYSTSEEESDYYQRGSPYRCSQASR